MGIYNQLIMQAFLPYKNFKDSLKSLDYKRLGKQRVEAKQMLNILDGNPSRYANHPAVKMWEGYRDALAEYLNCSIDEWVSRGYNNTMEHANINDSEITYPWWLGDEQFHRAMRARLIAKDREYYLPQFPEDEGFNDSKYFWPVNETQSYRII